MKSNIIETSMVNPSTDALMEKMHTRYGLVVLAARRARELLAGEQPKVKSASTKDVTNALEEILEGKITYAIKDDNEIKEEEFAEESEEDEEKDETDE
ncbi:MAG: DNA-directed RNA polymerase subunit omega [Selenomonadaceae bacterium]|nr:DNA-directed RNA polymerase subunit omega [Selenomonadaceae bacterium]